MSLNFPGPNVVRVDRRPALVGQAPFALSIGRRRLEQFLGPEYQELLDLHHIEVACSAKEARAAAQRVWESLSVYQPMLLAGRKVAAAFGVRDRRMMMELGWHNGRVIVIIPHPSSRSRFWNSPGYADQAAAFFSVVCAVRVNPGKGFNIVAGGRKLV